MATTPVRPGTLCGAKTWLCPPDSLDQLIPQQETVPSWCNAHVYLGPAATAVASVIPATVTGR